MKYRVLTPEEIEAYNIGYKVGSRQCVIKIIEFDSPEEKKIYRQGYNAGCQDRKRHNVNPYEIGSNVSNVSNVSSYDSGSNVSNVSNVTPYDSAIAIVNNIPDNININNNIYNPGNNIQDNNKLSGISNNLSTTHASEEDRTLEIQFNTFWEVFPKQRKAGKTKPRQKFFQIVKSKQATAEQLIKAAEDYAKSDTVIRGYAKEPYSWLLNERYLCDYTTQIRPMPQMSLKEMKQIQNEIELEKIRRGEK